MFDAGWKTLKTCKGKNVAWNIIWNLLLWRRSQLHIFTSCNSHLTFLTLVGGGGAIIILSKVLNSFNDIFRWETSTSVQRKSQKGNLRQILFLFTFYQWKYFSGLWEMTTFSIFISKMQNEQGILLFIHRKLAWKSEVSGTHSGSLFEILVARGYIVGASGDQAPI